jgi:hypothetical protein
MRRRQDCAADAVPNVGARAMTDKEVVKLAAVRGMAESL